MAAATVPINEAQADLARILERVTEGEEITLTRRGEAAAVMVRPDALRVRRAAGALNAAAGLQEALRQGRSARLDDDHPGLDERRAEALIDYVRESRTATRGG